MNDANDQQLLAEYANGHSNSAFAELLSRYVDLVYSASLRMVSNRHAAEDITQAVFLALAQNAPQLTCHPVLSGWLHTTARNIAAKTVRADVRRQAREREAVAMNELLAAEPDQSWEEISPQLDAALGALNGSDRDAILLRYFQKKSAQEMAVVLGVSADAAQKRVNRAVDRLREIFVQRGFGISASGIVLVVSANAIQAAPVGLASTITAATLGACAASTAATSVAIKTIAMTTLQKTIVTAAVTVLAGVALYQFRQSSHLRDQVQDLQRRQASVPAQVQQLIRERDDATNRLAVLMADNARLKSNPYREKALKLQNENDALRARADEANDPFIKQALAWKENTAKLHQLFEQHPELQVPELALLSEEQWFAIAKGADLNTEKGIRMAESEVRHAAKNNFMPDLESALSQFVQANDGLLPTDLSQLQPYFKKPVDDAILQQYKLTATGKYKSGFVVRDKAVIDKDYDYTWQVGPYGYGPDATERTLAEVRAQEEILKPVLQAYSAANNNAEPKALSNLKPFITTPEQQTAFEKLIDSGYIFGGSK